MRYAIKRVYDAESRTQLYSAWEPTSMFGNHGAIQFFSHPTDGRVAMGRMGTELVAADPAAILTVARDLIAKAFGETEAAEDQDGWFSAKGIQSGPEVRWIEA